MKNRELVWLPLVGIMFIDLDPLIITSEKWIIYQMVSVVIFATYFTILTIPIFQ